MGSPSTARCFTANSVLYCSLNPHPKSMGAAAAEGESSSSLTDLFPAYVVFAFSFLTVVLLFAVVAWKKWGLFSPDPDEEQSEQLAAIAASDISSLSALKLYLAKISENPDQASSQRIPTHISQSLLVELLTSNSPNWAPLVPCGGGGVTTTVSNDSRPGDDDEEPEGKKRKKKKKGKKNKSNNQSLLLSSNPPDLKTGEPAGEVKNNDGSALTTSKDDLVCLYPFTSSSSATQRKIKQHYDQLVKSRDSKGLTLAQVGQFVDSLVDSRNELQQKSEVIRRKFTITKALLLRADRSSFDRLRQQLYKLEAEQKRLEEDAFVYNWLQHQLKLSPAYKKMLETNASKELEAKSQEPAEKAETEDDVSDISFEELLAQEKKDSFWQKHSKQRLSSFS